MTTKYDQSCDRDSSEVWLVRGRTKVELGTYKSNVKTFTKPNTTTSRIDHFVFTLTAFRLVSLFIRSFVRLGIPTDERNCVCRHCNPLQLPICIGQATDAKDIFGQYNCIAASEGENHMLCRKYRWEKIFGVGECLFQIHDFGPRATGEVRSKLQVKGKCTF